MDWLTEYLALKPSQETVLETTVSPTGLTVSPSDQTSQVLSFIWMCYEVVLGEQVCWKGQAQETQWTMLDG